MAIQSKINSLHWETTSQFTYTFVYPEAPWLEQKHASDIATPDFIQSIMDGVSKTLQPVTLQNGTETVTSTPIIRNFRMTPYLDGYEIEVFVSWYINNKIVHNEKRMIDYSDNIKTQTESFLSKLEPLIEPDTIDPDKYKPIRYTGLDGPVGRWHKKNGQPYAQKIKIT